MKVRTLKVYISLLPQDYISSLSLCYNIFQRHLDHPGILQNVSWVHYVNRHHARLIRVDGQEEMASMMMVLINAVPRGGNKLHDNSRFCHISEVCKNSVGLIMSGLSFPDKDTVLQLTPLKTKKKKHKAWQTSLGCCGCSTLVCRHSALVCLMGAWKVARFDWDQEQKRQHGSLPFPFL